jgi:hypothetical protein
VIVSDLEPESGEGTARKRRFLRRVGVCPGRGAGEILISRPSIGSPILSFLRAKNPPRVFFEEDLIYLLVRDAGILKYGDDVVEEVGYVPVARSFSASSGHTGGRPSQTFTVSWESMRIGKLGVD